MSGEGVPEAGPCVPLLQGHQPGFSHSGDSLQGGLQVMGGLGSLPECSRHSAIPMATPLVKMLELVFMLADTEKKKSWTQTEFFSRKEAGRRGQAGAQTVLAAILLHRAAVRRKARASAPMASTLTISFGPRPSLAGSSVPDWVVTSESWPLSHGPREHS